MKTAAVIGASSMLGSRLTSYLSSMGVEVVSIGRREDSDIYLDLDEKILTPPPEHLRAEVIFHCAASFADDSYEGIRRNFQTNATSSLLVLELAEQLGCRSIVYAGTLSSSDTLDNGQYTSYGVSKAQAETVLAWGMKRLGLHFCSLRFTQIYDTAGACVVHQPWFGRIIAYASRGLNLNMPRSDGVRNFLHLDDAISLMAAAGTMTVDGIHNVLHPEFLTYQEIAATAYSIFGRGGKISIDENKKPFRPLNLPDNIGAYKILGLVPSISIAEGISRIRDDDTWSAFGPMDVT